jgi:glycosyltransferase involved in cell wall biosynthesis
MTRSVYVSIGLPVYNGEDYLEAAIASLLAQTFTDFELIISDNASSDRTAEICEQFAAQDERIHYSRNAENLGAAENFNRVVHLARGEYFKWAAHDDLCEPTFLERCVEVLDADPTVVLCSTGVGCIDWAGNLRPPKHDPPRNLRSWEPAERFRAIVLQTFWSYEIFGVVRLETLRQTLLQTANYGGDRAILAELSLHGRFFQVPETLFWRRFHLKQSTCLPTQQQRLRWNAGKRKVQLWERGCISFVRAIFRTPLDWRDRLACCAIVVQYLTKRENWLYFLPRHWRQRKPLPGGVTN